MSINWDLIFNREEAELIELDQQVESIVDGYDSTPLDQIIIRHIATIDELIWLAENRIPFSFSVSGMTQAQRDKIIEMQERWNDVLGHRIFMTEYLR